MQQEIESIIPAVNVGGSSCSKDCKERNDELEVKGNLRSKVTVSGGQGGYWVMNSEREILGKSVNREGTWRVYCQGS